MQIWNIANAQEQIDSLKEMINRSSNIAIFGHDNVDGDCIWSMLGFGKLLEKLGKKVTYHTSFDVPMSRFDWIEGIDKISTDFDFKPRDMIVLVDCNSYHRISKFYHMKPGYFDQADNVVVIDHHLYDNLIWKINLIDTTSSSCCELIREISKYIFEDNMVDRDVATYLCIGTISDTGTFKHEKDTTRTFTNTMEMVNKWVDKRYIVNNLEKINIQEVMFMWEFLQRIKIKWNIWYTYYTEQDLKKYNIESGKWGQSIIKKIDNIPVSIVFGYKNEKYGWSMRTKSNHINLSDIATKLWWGWHQKAAWFEMKASGDFHDWIEDTVDKINDMVSDYTK